MRPRLSAGDRTQARKSLSRAITGFNEAPAERRGSARQGKHADRHGTRFNEAPAERRGSAIDGKTPPRHSRASMRPRLSAGDRLRLCAGWRDRDQASMRPRLSAGDRIKAKQIDRIMHGELQ